jgi:PHD/YefM family antitoxin component YafN of YafNO toxin-antitoxin module
MRTTNISHLRTDITRLVEELRTADEPVIVLQGSSVAAYLVSPEQWDAVQEQLKHLRERNHELYEEVLQAAEDQPSEPFDLDEFLAEHGLTRTNAG